MSTRTSKIQLPRTGQTTSYTDYDDGYFQAGSPIAPRFINNGDNTVTDRVTNRTWIQRPELIIPDGLNSLNKGVEKGDYVQAATYAAGDIVTDTSDSSAWICLLPNTTTETYFATERTNYGLNWQQSTWATSNGSGGVNPNYFDWATCIANCHGLTKSGKSDWYLPNVKELQSIVDYGTFSPAINTTMFPNTRSSYYWSSTSYAYNSVNVWCVHFYDGYSYFGGKYPDYYVRPVRQNS